MIEAAADIIVFGNLNNCENCGGQIFFKYKNKVFYSFLIIKLFNLFLRKNKYFCSNCETIIDTPKRSGDVKIPKNNQSFNYFESIEKINQKRILYLTPLPEKSKLIKKKTTSVGNINSK